MKVLKYFAKTVKTIVENVKSIYWPMRSFGKNAKRKKRIASKNIINEGKI